MTFNFDLDLNISFGGPKTKNQNTLGLYNFTVHELHLYHYVKYINNSHMESP